MLTGRSAEIVRSLMEENLHCHELAFKSSFHMSSPVDDELRRLAAFYHDNAQDLHTLMEVSSVSADEIALQQPGERNAIDLLKSVFEAAKRLRRQYAAGVNATRELSEQLPRQMARAEIACSKLKRLCQQYHQSGPQCHPPG